MASNKLTPNGLYLSMNSGNPTCKVVKDGDALQLQTGGVAVRALVYSNNTYSSIKHTATLLGADGNAVFPNNVKANSATFSGNVTTGGQFRGSAMSALEADLAEIYVTDQQYAPGTLVCFGGDNEVTIASDRVNGVISSKPGYLLNDGSKGQPIALVGRVPILVRGAVKKFDRIVLSDAKKDFLKNQDKTMIEILENNKQLNKVAFNLGSKLFVMAKQVLNKHFGLEY